MEEEFEKRIRTLEDRVSKLEGDLSEKNESSSGLGDKKKPQVSVVEFMREKGPSSSVEKTLVFAVYHEEKTGDDVFGTEDLLDLWRQAKETRPSNINDLINKNVKKGLIAEEKVEKGLKKKWYVTTSGLSVVAGSFKSNDS